MLMEKEATNLEKRGGHLTYEKERKLREIADMSTPGPARGGLGRRPLPIRDLVPDLVLVMLPRGPRLRA